MVELGHKLEKQHETPDMEIGKRLDIPISGAWNTAILTQIRAFDPGIRRH